MYKLICMSYDGDYVIDYKGTKEECELASENMGSKWYFYPWHIIVNERDIIDEFYGCLINMKTKTPILSFFEGEELKTVKEFFKECSELEESQGMEIEEYELLLEERW